MLNHKEKHLNTFPKAKFIQILLPISNTIKLEINFLIKLKNCLHLENTYTHLRSQCLLGCSPSTATFQGPPLSITPPSTWKQRHNRIHLTQDILFYWWCLGLGMWVLRSNNHNKASIWGKFGTGPDIYLLPNDLGEFLLVLKNGPDEECLQWVPSDRRHVLQGISVWSACK